MAQRGLDVTNCAFAPARTPIAAPQRGVLEASIVIKNTGDRYQETPVNLA
jgi:hypothetical protein